MNKNRILVFGIVAFAALWLVCVVVMAPHIEADILSRATKRLDVSSLPLNVIDVQGRDIVASGIIDTEARRDAILLALSKVEGVRRIEDSLEVARSAVVQRKPATERISSRIVIRFANDATVLHGVLASEQQRLNMIDIARQFGADGPVHDRIEVVEGINDIPGLASFGLVLRVLSRVDNGVLRADAEGITIEGNVVDESTRVSVGRLVRAAVSGLNVVNSLKVISSDSFDDAFDSRIDGQSDLDEGLSSGDVQKALADIFKESRIDFVGDDALLTAQSQRLLNQVAGVLLEYPRGGIEIAGHTEDLGDREVEDELSRSRAQAVLDYLSGRGVARSRLRSVGYGSKIPNPRAEGMNRRIEFHLTGEE